MAHDFIWNREAIPEDRQSEQDRGHPLRPSSSTIPPTAELEAR